LGSSSGAQVSTVTGIYSNVRPVLARTRPDRSFERLYERHAGDVYRYALAVMRNQSDAEDVTQTTFLNAYRAFQRGERPQRAHNWLIAIAHNVCRQRFRQSARRPTEVSFDDDIAHVLVTDEPAPTGEDIRRALGHLAFNQRAALVMRELEGRTYAEIAEILEVSTSAVETLIFRARRALREQLESSLSCGEAELAISRQLDGRLDRKQKGALRAHLRECEDCAGFARRQRAQRTALKSLVAVPLPASLSSFFGGGAAVGTGLAAKAAVAVTVGVVVGGSAYEGVRHAPWHSKREAIVAPAPAVRDIAADAAIVPAVREHIPLARHPAVTVTHAEARARGPRAGASLHGHGPARLTRSHGPGKALGRGRGRGNAAQQVVRRSPVQHGHAKPARAHPSPGPPVHAGQLKAKPAQVAHGGGRGASRGTGNGKKLSK
jgi:RNA polymerase sigma factor (sigma-70 family)